MKAVKVMEEKWDYLIILDACRFDYFENTYRKYLEGSLEKRISPGSWTLEWRNKSFPKFYPGVVYVSGNPFITSNIKMKGFIGSEHFKEVVDVWSSFWDEKKGTVYPEHITKEALKRISKKQEGERFIIHYLQPHEPYLSVDNFGYQKPEKDALFVKKGGNILNKIVSFILNGIKTLGITETWWIREKLGMEPACPMDEVRRKLGTSGLKKAYQDNLDAVLKEVAELVKYLDGRIIITADHGEMLGENGFYCHWRWFKHKHLNEIPWLVIEKKGKKEYNKSDIHRVKTDVSEEEMKKRLKSLGYM